MGKKLESRKPKNLASPSKTKRFMSDSSPNIMLFTRDHMQNWGFPSEVEFLIPDENELAETKKRGWICFFEYPFRIGLKFPFSPFIRSFFQSTKILPCQLMPSIWRMLVSIERLTEKFGLSLHSSVVWESYSLIEFDIGRYIFRVRKNCPPLIYGTSTANDRGWRSRFFFVNLGSLGSSGDFLPTRWTSGTLSLLLLCAFTLSDCGFFS